MFRGNSFLLHDLMLSAFDRRNMTKLRELHQEDLRSTHLSTLSDMLRCATYCSRCRATI